MIANFVQLVTLIINGTPFKHITDYEAALSVVVGLLLRGIFLFLPICITHHAQCDDGTLAWSL